MIVSKKWKDFTVLDCGNEEKLERWGRYTLVRPDSQILWQKENPKLWKESNACYLKPNPYKNHHEGTWKTFVNFPNHWLVSYRDLTFKVKLTAFKHTGLFPEQAANWDWLETQIKNHPKKVKLLNLFGYTGGASVAACKSGAFVTHVDALKSATQWCQENAELSNLGKNAIRTIVDDVFKFVDREIKRGNVYDAILMDPPSFGRGKKKEIWKLEADFYHLLKKVLLLLSPKPLCLLVNVYKTGFSANVLNNLMLQVFGRHKAFRAENLQTEEIALPIHASKLVLPCGITARFSTASFHQ